MNMNYRKYRYIKEVVNKNKEFENKVYTYLKDAKLKDESCSENTKNWQ